MTSDEALVARARDGDDAAFDELVDRHADHVWGICLRYFGNPHDAEDAFQAAFLACYRGLRSFRGQAQLSTWLYRVATNACHDLARRAARQPRVVPLDADRHADGDAALDQAAADRLAAAELQPELATALRELDPEQRHAVVLRDVVGCGYREIADLQHVAVGTAKSRVHRGHARLAELLAVGNRSTAADHPTGEDPDHR
jgi:RNA polymerase sigma-70 factor (ECF subfamily)